MAANPIIGVQSSTNNGKIRSVRQMIRAGVELLAHDVEGEAGKCQNLPFTNFANFLNFISFSSFSIWRSVPELLNLACVINLSEFGTAEEYAHRRMEVTIGQ